MTDPRTIKPDDLFRFNFLQEAKLSPDSMMVIYGLSRVDTDADKEYTDLWLYNKVTDEHRRMTSGDSRDNGAAWSPDGRTIAFTSTRDGKPQIYLLPVDGGEARQLTHMKQGAGGPHWSPDGSKIAFTCGPDYGEGDPPDLTKDVYRVTRNVYRFDAIGYLDQAVSDIYIIDVDAGKDADPLRLTDDDTLNTISMWAPDGNGILYSAMMAPDAFALFYPTVRLVDLDGNITDVAGDQHTPVQAAKLTPDGTKLVYMGSIPGSDIGTKSDLWVLDLDSGELTNRTPNLAVGVGGGLSGDMPTGQLRLPALRIPNNDSCYVQVQAGGDVQIYKIALHGDEHWEPVVSGERAVYPLDIVNDSLLYAETTINATPDLYLKSLIGDIRETPEEQITYLNADLLAELTLPEPENIIFTSADGTHVEGWFLKPPVGEAPYPTILYIHGGPHSAYGNTFHFDFQMLAGAGYGVLFINHRASTGYGNRFATMIKGDWGNLDYADLMAGVDYAIAQGLADADRLGCCGTSGGGNLSSWIVGNTDRFKAAVPQNPVTSWRSFYGTSDIGVWFSVEELGGHPWEIPDTYDRCSPITYAHNCTTPTLMVQSEHDWRCPAEQSEQFYTVLKANGCVVEMLRQPGGSHGASVNGALNLRREHNAALLDWFGHYVLGQEPEEAVE